jgi:hypothetical protein
LENELRSALDKVRAEDALKRKTSEFLRSEIAKRERAVFRFRPAFVTVCAVFVLFTAIGGFSVYLTPTAHIDFDVNPSVGLAVNRFGIVIEAVAYNEDGSDILQNAGVKNKPYAKAAGILMEAFISHGYLADNGLVSATVQTNNQDYESNLLTTLTGVVNLSLSDHHINAETDLFPVDKEVMTAAHGHHMTPAKYLAIAKLLELDPTATFEDRAEHSISEIRELIHSHGSGAEHSAYDNCGEAKYDDESDATVPAQCENGNHHDEQTGRDHD